MRFDLECVKRNKRWHVPASIATLAMGIYLILVCLIPPFAPGLHENVTTGKFLIILPYVIFVLISSPLFSLWYYTKLEADGAFREQIKRWESD